MTDKIFNNPVRSLDFSLNHMIEHQEKAVLAIYMMIRACNIQLKVECLKDVNKHNEQCPKCKNQCHIWNYRKKLCESLILCATPNNLIDELTDVVLNECRVVLSEYKKQEMNKPMLGGYDDKNI